jgi:hypothetical protein
MKVKNDRLTWQAALSRWKAHDVRQISIVDREGEATYLPQRWINRNGSDAQYIYGNPVNCTGLHLALGTVTKTPEMFAAFAIHAFLVEKHSPHPELDALARMALDRYDNRPGDYWHSNARRVLPIEGDRRLDPDERSDWKGWIDAAARVWTRLESDHSVLRWSGDAALGSRPPDP